MQECENSFHSRRARAQDDTISMDQSSQSIQPDGRIEASTSNGEITGYTQQGIPVSAPKPNGTVFSSTNQPPDRKGPRAALARFNRLRAKALKVAEETDKPGGEERLTRLVRRLFRDGEAGDNEAARVVLPYVLVKADSAYAQRDDGATAGSTVIRLELPPGSRFMLGAESAPAQQKTP